MARETVRVEGLNGVLDALRSLPGEIVSKNGGPVKLALKRAADVLLAEAKANVRRIIDTPNVGGQNDSTGLLLLSLQSKRSKVLKQNGEAYVVSIKRDQKYPDFKQDKAGKLTATQIGRQLEYGTEKRQPMPWLRPAFDAKKGEALRVFVDEMQKRTAAAIKKAERMARLSK